MGSFVRSVLGRGRETSADHDRRDGHASNGYHVLGLRACHGTAVSEGCLSG